MTTDSNYSLSYCPPDSPLWVVWLGAAFNSCFFDTTVTVLQVLLVGVCATLETRTYYKHATKVDPHMLGDAPVLYLVQCGLGASLVGMNVLRFALRFTWHVFGYMIVHDVFGAAVWVYSTCIVYMERHYDLPTLPRGRHSVYLIIFWCSALFMQTLYLLNIMGDRWFFNLNRTSDYVLLVLYLVQWLAELFVLVIGLRAPGLLSYLARNQYIYKRMQHSKYGSFACSPGHSAAYSHNKDMSSRPEHSESVLELSLNAGGAFAQSIDALRADLHSHDLILEFQTLQRQWPQGSTSAARHPVNETKNRYYNVLPYDNNRVHLHADSAAAHVQPQTQPYSEQLGQDYINASWVSLTVPDVDISNQYICTQAPTQHTMMAFWHMVWQERVPLLVMLTDLQEQGVPKCMQYWPQLNDTIELPGGRVVLSCTQVQASSRSRGYTVRKLFMVDTQSSEQLSVVHMQLHAWPDHGTPKHCRKVIDFWRLVRERMPARHLHTATGHMVTSPMLVHCSAGVGRTGAFILLDMLIAHMEAESPLRPIQLVQQMRQQRMAMVQTDQQLHFACCTALLYYDTCLLHALRT